MEFYLDIFFRSLKTTLDMLIYYGTMNYDVFRNQVYQSIIKQAEKF